MKQTCILLLAVFFSLMQVKTQPTDIFLNIQEYGATGDKKQKVTAIIQRTIDLVHQQGGGTVYFPPGDYLSGTVVLKDNVNIYLESGATLLASRDAEDYQTAFKIIKQNPNNNPNIASTPVLLYANDAENITLSGGGKIHGQAERKYVDYDAVDTFIEKEIALARKSGVEMKRYVKIPPITYLFFFENCNQIKIQDLQFVESQAWTIHFKWSKNIFIDNVYVQSSLNAGVNSDGIDIDGCSNVVINNCIIETGDDAIVLKTTSTNGKSMPCEDISVSNCVLTSTSAALKLGTESYADFRRITFNNCAIKNTNRALGIIIRDGATASDILFSDMVIECNRKHFNWWGNADPFWLVVKKRNPNSKIGHIANVRFENIMARVQGTGKIEGYPGYPIQNISLVNVDIRMEHEDKKDKRTVSIMELHDVVDISLENIHVSWNEKQTQESWKYAFNIYDIENLRLDKLNGSSAPLQNDAFIRLTNIKNGIVERCVQHDDDPFVQVMGDSKNLVLRNNISFDSEITYDIPKKLSNQIKIQNQ